MMPRNWLRAFSFPWRSPERDVDAELTFHVEARTADLVAVGVPDSKARAQAVAELGDGETLRATLVEIDTRMERTHRRMAWFDAIVRDLRYAWRGLRRAPAFALTAVALLALGLGANAAAFSTFEALLLRPLPYPAADQLVAIALQHKATESSEVPDVFLDAWRQRAAGVVTLAGYVPTEVTVVGTEGPERVTGAYVDEHLAGVLGVHPALGRWVGQGDVAGGFGRVVVLGDGLWRRQFNADSTIIGRAIRLDDTLATVLGVMPRGFDFPRHSEYWLANARARTGMHFLSPVVGRRGSTVSNEKLGSLLASTLPERPGTVVRARPLREALFGSARPFVQLVLGATFVFLLIACVNVTNLSLARVVARRREFAVRVTLGAGRGALVRQIAIEHALIVLASAVAGLSIAVILSRLAAARMPAEYPGWASLGSDWRVASFFGSMTVAAGLAIAVLPMLGVARGDLTPALHHGSDRAGKSVAVARWRHALVAAQLAMALMLATCSGLLVKSTMRLAAVDLGIQPGRIALVTFRRPTRDSASAIREATFLSALARELRATPGVQSVALGPPPLVSGHMNDGFNSVRFRPRDSSRPLGPDNPGSPVFVKFVDPRYFATYGIPVLAGRAIDAGDGVGAPPVAVLNAAAARDLAPGGVHVGSRLEWYKPLPIRNSFGEPTVVGVVADVRQEGITVPALPEIYVPLAQQELLAAMLDQTVAVRTTGDPRKMLDRIRRVARMLEPDLAPRRLTTMPQIIAGLTAPTRLLLALLGGFAVLAVVLAVVGVYAVVSYLVTRRTSEFGIRLALGATSAQVARLVLREAVVMATTGLAIGVVSSLALARLLTSYMYETRPNDADTFIAVALAVAGATMIASYLPVRRAVKVDPVIALRAE